MSKGGFPFAAVPQLPALMAKLERDYLTRYTPCHGFDEEQLIEAIAVVHIELILIHPFREGNGRLARLLADVMALQAGYPELDFSSWDAVKDKYVSAIHAGLDCDYTTMQELVRQALLDGAKVS
jgi:cell filamentation protein